MHIGRSQRQEIPEPPTELHRNNPGSSNTWFIDVQRPGQESEIIRGRTKTWAYINYTQNFTAADKPTSLELQSKPLQGWEAIQEENKFQSWKEPCYENDKDEGSWLGSG